MIYGVLVFCLDTSPSMKIYCMRIRLRSNKNIGNSQTTMIIIYIIITIYRFMVNATPYPIFTHKFCSARDSIANSKVAKVVIVIKYNLKLS